ncbi:hypothetical protein [Janthinobacterium sp. B9-8]|uniref:hypothetical protein n=1 Tax=Janthinobacterium sp. B9-8 TaxID=1236179 RepID=UPI00061D272E|nr:hypothetical protein [Janthinobacterium sp. B9-8]AMC34748.1 hypothetical protein VN23_09070 [Janthinobacterium sp. B9-8]
MSKSTKALLDGLTIDQLRELSEEAQKAAQSAETIKYRIIWHVTQRAAAYGQKEGADQAFKEEGFNEAAAVFLKLWIDYRDSASSHVRTGDNHYGVSSLRSRPEFFSQMLTQDVYEKYWAEKSEAES